MQASVSTLAHTDPTAMTRASARGLQSNHMQAIVYDNYGSLEGLGLRDIETPALGDDDVRIRVRAAGLHVGDVFSVRGTPYLMRVATGLLRPRYGVPGFDVAGEVDAIGKNVTAFAVGDEVFGAGQGTCAEFATVKAEHLAHKPANLTFEEAASMPTSALAALHALRDVAKVKEGDRVLINGASGGVGTFAVQIAKSFGAHVTGVCSTANVEMVASLGADRVIDYRAEDFTQGTEQYDVIFDNVENRTLAECRQALAPRGILVLNSGTGAQGVEMFVRLLKPIFLSPFVGQRLRRYLSVPNGKDIAFLGGLAESGVMRPVVDRTYALRETKDALNYIDQGHARGKVVVSLAAESP